MSQHKFKLASACRLVLAEAGDDLDKMARPLSQVLVCHLMTASVVPGTVMDQKLGVLASRGQRHTVQNLHWIWVPSET